jgi:hypothetical protein
MITSDILNNDLIQEQGLTQEEVNALERLHYELEEELQKPIEEIKDIQAYNDNIMAIEYELQRLWHFPQDSNYHTWWFKDPKCLCGSMDNSDMIGTKYRTINGDCPLHGGQYDN